MPRSLESNIWGLRLRVSNAAPEQEGAGGISGARVVLAILGSLALVVGLVIIAFTVFEPEGAPCADGELATNRLVDGRYERRTEQFETVAEAEAFICHSVAELQADGWTLHSITAERTVPIEFLVEGEGIGVVSLMYVEDATQRELSLDAAPFFGVSYFESQVPPQRTEEPVTIAGRPGTAYRFGINPDFVMVIWVDETLEHQAVTQTSGEFALGELVEVLETAE